MGASHRGAVHATLNSRSPPMSERYPLADLDELPDDLRERILAEQEKAGFVPEVLLMFGRRPAEMRAFFAYHDALMEREGNLSKADKEMGVVAISWQNSCLYCEVAHGAVQTDVDRKSTRLN